MRGPVASGAYTPIRPAYGPDNPTEVDVWSVGMVQCYMRGAYCPHRCNGAMSDVRYSDSLGDWAIC